MVEKNQIQEIENDTTFQNLIQKLKTTQSENLIYFGLQIHDPVKTSQEAANIRGQSLSSGAKAILIKTKTKLPLYYLIVFAADKKLSWKKVKDFLKNKKLEMANEEEVFQLTGCRSGGVPPFGSLFGIQTYADYSLEKQGETINFNGGLRTHSVTLKVKDYLLIEKPIIEDFVE